LISISTSPAFGPSISMVSTVNGSPAFQATAARVFMISCRMMGGALLWVQGGKMIYGFFILAEIVLGL
jgi:hypothetical protein